MFIGRIYLCPVDGLNYFVTYEFYIQLNMSRIMGRIYYLFIYIFLLEYLLFYPL